MKIPTLIASLVTALCIVACSKEGGSGKAKGLVPATAAELAASADFKLEHTTESGVKCYVRELTPEVASTIAKDSRDHHFFEDRKHPYLLVFVCNGKIVDMTEVSAENPVFTTKQSSEIVSWGMQKAMKADELEKQVEEMLKKAGKQ